MPTMGGGFFSLDQSSEATHRAYHHQVQIDFSRPGKPTDNSFVETFDGSLRDECLNVHWFETVADAKTSIEAWRQDYNESRPHMALEGMSPAEFARALGARAQGTGSLNVGG